MGCKHNEDLVLKVISKIYYGIANHLKKTKNNYIVRKVLITPGNFFSDFPTEAEALKTYKNENVRCKYQAPDTHIRHRKMGEVKGIKIPEKNGVYWGIPTFKWDEEDFERKVEKLYDIPVISLDLTKKKEKKKKKKDNFENSNPLFPNL